VSVDPFLEPIGPALHRPEKLLASTTVQALRAAQCVLTNTGRFLDVWLFQDPIPALTDPTVWTLVPSPGGNAVHVKTAMQVAAPTPHLRLEISGSPDPARYRLEVRPPVTVAFDPLRTWLPVRLRPECPDLGSCFDDSAQPTAFPMSPVHDYSGRDWRSLRRSLVEYLVGEDPSADLSIADPTITLLELFAHVGDLLHYRLDRVATEAYLETARLRTSVRRHARLVDFEMSDGVAARTHVFVGVPPDRQTFSVENGDLASDHLQSDLAFTLELDPNDTPFVARGDLSEIPIYDWGEEASCLAAGATECVIVADAALLEPGRYLAFEIIDPESRAQHVLWSRRQLAVPWPIGKGGSRRLREPLPGRPAHIVRLTSVEPFLDPLASLVLGGPVPNLALVRWRPEDALPRAYPVGIDSSSGVDAVTVARGNVLPAHHGRLHDGGSRVTAPPRSPDADPDREAIAEYSLVAARAPRAGGPLLSLDGNGRPYHLDVRVTVPSGLRLHPPTRQSLSDAIGEDMAVVVDVEEDEPPILRFRTGAVGKPPPLGSEVSAAYEVGGGALGNVSPNALHMLERNAMRATEGATPSWDEVDASIVARNPVAASGGMDPTPLDEVRRDAPQAFAAVSVHRRRAVLAADHAAAVMEREDLVQRAMSRSAWNGSWPIITTVVDLLPDDPAGEARMTLTRRLDGLRMVGTEAAVVPGRAIGLFVALDVCVFPGVDTEAVRRAILARLRPGSRAQPGFFHSANLRLGTSVYVSAVVAAAGTVTGVDQVVVREARRLSEASGTKRDVITFAADEVGVLEDDPARPNHGRLDVVVRGG
jgi:hypothetical protein